MAEGKKLKYLSKTVRFQGKEISLYSIDGVTWSTRRQELSQIKERQEAAKVSFAAIKEENGETKVVAKGPSGSEDEDPIEEDSKRDEYEEFEEDVLDHQDTESPPPVKAGKDKKAAPKVAAPPPVKPAKGKAPQVQAKAAPKKNVKPAPSKKLAVEKVSPKKRASSKPMAKQPKAKSKSKQRAA